MKTHKVGFADAVRSKTDLAGLQVSDLLRKTGIPASTYRKRMQTGSWTRKELMALHRVIHFDAEDMKIFLEGR